MTAVRVARPSSMPAWTSDTVHCADGEATLLGLWGEPGRVHMAVLDNGGRRARASTVPTATIPPSAPLHAPAIRLERARATCSACEPVRPARHASVARSMARIRRAYPFLPVDGEGLHQIPVGPVHAGIIEPGHFRFTADGETVVRLEQRLGYVHKGIDICCTARRSNRRRDLAGRTSGDSTVAYAFAFARAVEAALGIEPPPRAVWLRGVMAELERIANHLGDFGAICNDASFSIMLAHCGMLRERVLRCAAALLRPSADDGLHRARRRRGRSAGRRCGALRSLVDEIRAAFRRSWSSTTRPPSLQDRTVGTGILSADLARRFGAGGYVGRASGRDFDARRSIGYPPYDQLRFEVPVLTEGDVNARASGSASRRSSRACR